MSEAVNRFRDMARAQAQRAANGPGASRSHAMIMLMAISAGLARLTREGPELLLYVGHEFHPVGLHTSDGSMLSQRCIQAIETAVEMTSGELPF